MHVVCIEFPTRNSVSFVCFSDNGAAGTEVQPADQKCLQQHTRLLPPTLDGGDDLEIW